MVHVGTMLFSVRKNCMFASNCLNLNFTCFDFNSSGVVFSGLVYKLSYHFISENLSFWYNQSNEVVFLLNLLLVALVGGRGTFLLALGGTTVHTCFKTCGIFLVVFS